MPLFYSYQVNLSTKLAIWQITEREEFFNSIPLSHQQVNHPHKRIQHLAGRFLLRQMNPDFPIERVKIEGKRPYLEGNSFHFSISHSKNFAAAIISKQNKVGIDIEPVTPRIKRLGPKFLTSEEQAIVLNGSAELSEEEKLTACWCAKECMVKWHQNGGLDFRKNMHILHISYQDEMGSIDASIDKGKLKIFKIHFRYFDQLCLAWLSDDAPLNA